MSTFFFLQIVCWRFEKDDDKNLVSSIKLIKQSVEGIRFSDVLLTAFSLSVKKYVESIEKTVPDKITVVHIVRFKPEGIDLHCK